MPAPGLRQPDMEVVSEPAPGKRSRRKRRHPRLLPGVLALFSALAVAAGPESGARERILSLDQALEIARNENPRIAIGRARRAGAQAARVRSRQGFSPRLTLDAYHLRLNTSLLDNIPTFEPAFPPVFVSAIWGPLTATSPASSWYNR